MNVSDLRTNDGVATEWPTENGKLFFNTIEERRKKNSRNKYWIHHLSVENKQHLHYVLIWKCFAWWAAATISHVKWKENFRLLDFYWVDKVRNNGLICQSRDEIQLTAIRCVVVGGAIKWDNKIRMRCSASQSLCVILMSGSHNTALRMILMDSNWAMNCHFCHCQTKFAAEVLNEFSINFWMTSFTVFNSILSFCLFWFINLIQCFGSTISSLKQQNFQSKHFSRIDCC